MAQDYSKSKFGPGSVEGEIYPIDAKDSEWQRVEPLVSPQQLRRRHLLGIPMVSFLPDPITGVRQKIEDSDIADLTLVAVDKVETLISGSIFATQFAERHPFDRQEFESYGYFRTRNRPVSSLQSVTVMPPTNEAIFSVPIEWVSAAYLPKGQINIIPLMLATSASNAYVSSPGAAGAGGAFIAYLASQRQWVPAYWEITYTAGFPFGSIPRIINYLIGITAAIDILSMLGATMAMSNSASLGIDGLSQSVSGPGPNVYDTRIKMLLDEQARYVKKVKKMISSLLAPALDPHLRSPAQRSGQLRSCRVCTSLETRGRARESPGLPPATPCDPSDRP